MSMSFDRVSDIYDATRGLPPEISEQVTNFILNTMSSFSDPHFLEIGIGTGRIAVPMVQQGYAYTGIDISEKMMAELRRKLEASDHRLTLLNADATALPFDDHSFDVAIAVHVFHLIQNWQQALAEVRRVLKPSGILLYTHGRTHFEKGSDQNKNDFSAIGCQWQTILESYGYEKTEYGAKEAEVLTALQEQGAITEPVVVATWETEQTIEDALNRYRHKSYSSSWRIPDEIHEQAIADLITWCECHYESFESKTSSSNQFKFNVVKHWTTSAAPENLH